MNAKKYYHITSIENHLPILLGGIESNEDGEIFLFDTWEIRNTVNDRIALVCDFIALNQVGLFDEILIIEVNPKGIKVDPIPDNVGEMTAKFQWIVKQQKIYPSYCKVIGRRKPDADSIHNFWK